MAPFENIKTFEFVYEDQQVQWQLQSYACFSFVLCPHPVFINRFGHANILVKCFDNIFDEIIKEDDDYDFFKALQQSVYNYPFSNLNAQL
jgi:hypothetical protein